MNNIDITALKARSSGQCGAILLSLAPHLAPMIERGRRHGPCPLCAGTDRARCHNDFDETGGVYCNQCGQQNADLFATLQWANGWTFPQTIDAVTGFLGQSKRSNLPFYRKAKPVQGKGWTKELKKLQTIWDSSCQDTGRITEYLQSRDLSVPVPPTLRLHLALSYFHAGVFVSKLPAMVARVERDGFLVGIHTTWLDHEGSGKANLPAPKKLRKCSDTMSGGAVRLFEPLPGIPLVLAEGIETALTSRQLTGLPVWSCCNAAMLEKIWLPDSIRELQIAVDKDKSGAGQCAAERLAKRLVGEGRKVQIAIPPGPIPDNEKSLDWNDVLRMEVTHDG